MLGSRVPAWGDGQGKGHKKERVDARRTRRTAPVLQAGQLPRMQGVAGRGRLGSRGGGGVECVDAAVCIHIVDELVQVFEPMGGFGWW